jgi:ribosomal protein L11 methyltransferase
MSWRQLIVEPQEHVLPAVEAWLEQAGALALTLQDAGDAPVLEPTFGTMPLWPHTRVVALFDGTSDLGDIAQRLRSAFDDQALACVLIETLEDRVWELEWRRDYRPMRFGERLWVTPPDGLDQIPSGAVTLILEPGLAFGTGTHPTTALCLRWLDQSPPEGRSVLDYGCGSGILAVAAACLGAAQVTATDIDPQALLATRDNAARNNVQVTVLQPAALELHSYDLLVANIISGTLLALADELARLCRPGGDLVLSGILTEQVEAVAGRYCSHFDLRPAVQLDDWCLLHGIRRRDAVD